MRNKRFCALLLVVFTISAVLVGCGEDTSPQVFTTGNFSITLPAGFESKDNLAAGYECEAVYHSDEYDEMFICVRRDDFTSEIGLDELTLEEYVSMCLGKDPTERENVIFPEYPGLTCYQYDYSDGGDNPCVRMCFVYKGSDAFWRIDFSGYADLVNENRSIFADWARTVTVS